MTAVIVMLQYHYIIYQIMITSGGRSMQIFDLSKNSNITI